MANLVPTALAVIALSAITVAVFVAARLPRPAAAPLAILRGVFQLALVALVLRGVIASVWLVALALVVMFGVAATTSARRLGFSWRRLGVVAGSMVLGAATALSVVFLSGALETSPHYLLALGGIVIGNSMSIATLAGRRLFISAAERWDEVEGWLALGALPRDATRLVRRQAAFEALVPSVDQTRTTGLVTLPGSFVGAIFGGASPAEAARFQILVLACVIAAGSLTAVVLMRALASIQTKPTQP